MPGLNFVLLYIDPGVGFLALQMLSGVALGAAFYFRRSIRIVLKVIRSRFVLTKPPGEEPQGQARDE